jgi:hypothetical protein
MNKCNFFHQADVELLSYLPHCVCLANRLCDCQVVLGLHIVRGDNICVVGEIDEEMDQRLGNNQQQHNELSLF